MILILLMLASTEVSVESGIVEIDPPQVHPLEKILDEEKAEVAIKIEDTLVKSGIAPRLARAATVNAIAESNLNPAAIGDKGKAVGVFQLHSGGMGSDMSIESRKDVDVSARKVARAIIKDKKMMSLQEKCASIEEMVRSFTIRIMRPKNMLVKAEQRVEMGKKILGAALDVECTPT